MSDLDLDELRDELADFAQPEKKIGRGPREERIIAGFEEIQRFTDEHGRAPQHGEDRDIFERLYAVRLDRLRALEECRSLLAPLDRQGLLSNAADDAQTGIGFPVRRAEGFADFGDIGDLTAKNEKLPLDDVRFQETGILYKLPGRANAGI